MTLWIPSRRRLLLAGTAAAGLKGILAHAQAPAVVAGSRPGFPSGVQGGDVLADRGIDWSRCDRPTRLWVEWSTSSNFSNVQRLRGPYALQTTDFPTRIDLAGLPAGQDIYYHVTWEDLAGGGTSAPMAGHFRTAPGAAGPVRLLWSDDTAGPGWGISNGLGGKKICEVMRALSPKSNWPTAASGAITC